MTKKGRLIVLLLAVTLSPFSLALLLWSWLLLSGDPFNHPLSKTGAWPIACSLRGCISTTAWQKQYQARLLFAKTLDQAEPHPNDALTTLVRQHLVQESFVQSPITVKDAVRYREEILQARDESKVLGSTGLRFNDYDKLVILPLLEQEALREERNVEDFDTLFKLIAQERSVWVFPASLRWDKAEAKVVAD